MELITGISNIQQLSQDLSISNSSSIGLIGFHVNSNQTETLFHEGHKFIIEKAREHCDILMIGLMLMADDLKDKTSYDLDIILPNDKIIDTNFFKDEYNKLLSYTNIDYVVCVDLFKNLVGDNINYFNTEEYKVSIGNNEYIKNKLTVSELRFRFCSLFGSLLNTNKLITFSCKKDLFDILTVNKVIKSFYDVGIGKLNKQFFNRLFVPIFRDKDRLLPEKLTEPAEVRNFRKAISNYFDVNPVTVGDDVSMIRVNLKSIKPSTEISCGVIAKDFENLNDIDIITNKSMLRVLIGSQNITGDNLPHWEDIRLVGYDETKWYKMITGEELEEEDL